jgi:cell division protein FtsL
MSREGATARSAAVDPDQESTPVSVYRLLRRGEGEAASLRSVILALVAVAAVLTAIGLIRVTRQHEVLRLGYELSRKSEQVRGLRETRRQLELELATLTAPARIERLATRLGMARVTPDRIRVVRPASLAQAPSEQPVAERVLR